MLARAKRVLIPAGALAVLLLAACDREPSAPAAPTVEQDDGVTALRIINADAEPENWLAHGRTYSEQRFSPLETVNRDTVSGLGLAWYVDLPTRRGLEATPLVIDGTMYVTSGWSMVYALDAASGEERWRYDPEVSKSWAQYACCDVVNRGVAAWRDAVFVGTIDGYLVSLDANTGKVNWRTDTIDRKPPYTITGAPRVINGLVIIGNGGAEYGVRGYVSAYDAASGELRWRFHTVPGNPEDGFETETMATAAGTWTGKWWELGGGGTVWDSMAYDPELDLLYIGTGNGSPWNQKLRSPDGGDNLFLSSIVALRPATGEYVWHYQTTPGDTWDFTATQHMILADVTLDGQPRKVLLQAPKNGFFYVLDRVTGELISANAYVMVNWAEQVNIETGRPVETPNARYTSGPFLTLPSPMGGHNWHPMAYSSKTGLVYIPTQDFPWVHADDDAFTHAKGYWNTGTRLDVSATPDDPEVLAALLGNVRGQLIAWDPVARQEVWRYPHAGPWNGGVLATAGDLVFQGSLIGEFAAYDAASGERLWQFNAQTGIAAAPVTYTAGGEQYVAVAAGWGSIFALFGGEGTAALKHGTSNRILAFRLGAQGALPPREPPAPQGVLARATEPLDPAMVTRGKYLYYQRCVGCHGDTAASGGVLPDLRYISDARLEAWDTFVLDGALAGSGMPGFRAILDEEDSAAIKTYVLDRARIAAERRAAAADAP